MNNYYIRFGKIELSDKVIYLKYVSKLNETIYLVKCDFEIGLNLKDLKVLLKDTAVFYIRNEIYLSAMDMIDEFIKMNLRTNKIKDFLNE